MHGDNLVPWVGGRLFWRPHLSGCVEPDGILSYQYFGAVLLHVGHVSRVSEEGGVDVRHLTRPILVCVLCSGVQAAHCATLVATIDLQSPSGWHLEVAAKANEPPISMAALWSEGQWPDLLERPCTGPFDFTFDGGLSWSEPKCGWWGNLSVAKVAFEHTNSGEYAVSVGTRVLFVHDENGPDWRFLSVPDGQVLAAGRSLVRVAGAFSDYSVCYFEQNADTISDIMGWVYFVDAGRSPVMVAELRGADQWVISLACVQDESHKSVLYTTASTRRAGDLTLWALDLGSGAVTRMKQTPPYICIPDLFDNDAAGLSRLRIRGDELQPVWRAELGYPAGFLSWSNDGDRIAFERADNTDVDSIVVLEADSGRIVDTIQTPGGRAGRVAYFDDNDRIHVVKRAEAVDLVYELAK